MIANFEDLFRAGLNVKVEKADVSLSGEQIRDMALRLFGAYSSGKRGGGGDSTIENLKFTKPAAKPEPTNESKSYNLNFNKWSKLWK